MKKVLMVALVVFFLSFTVECFAGCLPFSFVGKEFKDINQGDLKQVAEVLSGMMVAGTEKSHFYYEVYPTKQPIKANSDGKNEGLSGTVKRVGIFIDKSSKKASDLYFGVNLTGNQNINIARIIVDSKIDGIPEAVIYDFDNQKTGASYRIITKPTPNIENLYKYLLLQTLSEQWPMTP
ncbi:MAG: hypothetical protein UT05_C0014G0023 [Parcubacteria group bacterium GW2011_GWF2_38_76]|nr:MAG: hypothetical protein UT05_C0014G0023 [Parcubacteria group bacterium GW2011_GWF2_38_76]HBM46044.1 hypothetical protein [Patescibacteria group bacterium]